MKSNKKKILVCVAIAILLATLFISCRHDPVTQPPVVPAVKADAVELPVAQIASTNYQPATENAVQVISGSVAAINVEAMQTEKVCQTQPIPTTERTIKLSRIDYSGIYWLPDDVIATQVKSIFLNGKAARYSITENGNIDVFDSHLNTVVKAVIVYD